MLFKVLATVYLLSLNTGHRRKNERSIQYSNYNYKEDLNNFGNCTRILLLRKLLNCRGSRLISLILLRLQQLKKVLDLG